MSVTLTINGERVTAPKDSTILEAARSAGIYIPTLCHHPDLSNVGACRMCVVEVEGSRGLQTACTTPVRDGMVVQTETETVRQARKFTLEMLLSDHPNDCMTCEANGDCELQDLAYDYGVEWSEHGGARHSYDINPDPNPFILVDRNKCILCGRCVRACQEIQNRDVWNFANRGFETKLVAGADQLMLDADCESCGHCVAYCPTGALFDKMSLGKGRANQVEKVRTTCAYCGVGCNFDLNVRNGEIVRVTAAEDAPVNGVSLCVKGRYGYDYIHHTDRLERPLVRAKWLEDVEEQVESGAWSIYDDAGDDAITEEGPAGEATLTPDSFIETDWETALDLTARKFADVKAESGPDAFAMFASAKCTNEENYLFSKFTRQLMMTNSIDHCARL